MIDPVIIRGKEGHKVYNLWDGILEDYIDQQNGRYDDEEMESQAIDYAHNILWEIYGLVHENRYSLGLRHDLSCEEEIWDGDEFHMEEIWIVIDKEKAFRAKMNDYRRYEDE